VQQVAVGAVQFDGVDADAFGALRGGGKGIAQLGDLVQRQRGGRGFGGQVRQGRGGHGLPAALLGREQLAAAPGRRAGSLASGVAELQAHRHGRRQLACALQVLAHGGLGFVVPQAQAVGGDAAFGHDAGGLDGQQTGAAVEQAGPVRQVPVGGQAVHG
jgi:hypothetical protein